MLKCYMKCPGMLSEFVVFLRNVFLNNLDEQVSRRNEKRAEVKIDIVPKDNNKVLNKPADTCIKKQYLKSNDSCKVTFRLPKDAVPGARVVTIVGDFNNWDTKKTPMKKLKNGEFKLEMNLSRKREYRFKYLIDSKQWENDWYADKYVPNAYGNDDSVVVIQ